MFSKIKQSFQSKKLIPIIVVMLFFGLYLSIGFSIYKDYGVSTDERTDKLRGRLNYERIMGEDVDQFLSKCSQSKNICYYPSLFSVISYVLSRSNDTREVYLRKHLITFAFFAFSVFVFFLIGKKIFKDWKIGLLGSLFLILSPRIFASSFYNPKDIPFLSSFIIAIYTLLLFLEKKTVFTAILHGIVTGIVCCIRTPGLVVIPITILFLLFDYSFSKRDWKTLLKIGGVTLCFILVLLGLIYLFTPILYTNPIQNFIKSFNLMKSFPWNNYHLYMGKDIGSHIPWHYSIVWFSISSPIFYLILFILGIATLIIRSINIRHLAQMQEMRNLYLIGTFGFLPILVVIVMKSVIYTENRQMYFCYPPLLLIALYGFNVLAAKIKSIANHWQLWVGLTLILGLAYPVYFMIRYHPNQNVYFNFLAGSNMSIIKTRFGLDGWGLATRQGLEYILKTDPSNQITVQFLDSTINNYYILPKSLRQRLIVDGKNPPKYAITIYRRYPSEQFTEGKVYYSVKVGDTDISTVYILDGN